MANHNYFAILYVFDKDGEFRASMPCRNYDEVMLRASKYQDYVKVVPYVGSPFRIRVKAEKLNGHKGAGPVESVDPLKNGHHYDGTGSLIQTSRPPLPEGVGYDYWKSKSNSTKFS